MGPGRREIEKPAEYTIVVKELADEDIFEIVKWYDKQADGLGERFIRKLRIAIQKLTTHPFAFGVSYKDVRKIKLDRFPYLIFYQVKNSEVYIHGVIHAKRKPGFYKKRFGDI